MVRASVPPPNCRQSICAPALPNVRRSTWGDLLLNTISICILDSSLVRPCEVFKDAILASSAAIIVAHNHSSGDPTPSIEDKRVTQRLYAAGQLLGIDLLDHVAGLQPVEVWEYPRLALREAVANALLHRDYTDSGRIMMRVYDDHILITSPGTLPEGITLDDLSRDPHPSKLRNPLLAQAFYFTEIVERWGSGTTRMAELCVAQNLPAPEFALVGGEVHVTFRKDPYTEERLKAQGLSARQIQAVRYVRERSSISRRVPQLDSG